MPAALFVFGLLFGSFLNVCIHRLPRGRSVVSPGSACAHCGHPLRAYDNVPLLSYVLLRGRCRDCGRAISFRYPAVELATALLFLACALHFPSPLAIAKNCVLCALLLVLLFTDLEQQLLPDAVTLPGALLGLLFAGVVYVPGMPAWMLAPHTPLEIRLLSLLNAIVGGASGAAFLFLVAELYYRSRGVSGMGQGDLKLMALIGAFLGFRLVFFVLFAAAIVASVFGIAALLLLFRKRLVRYRRGERAAAASPPRRRAWTGATLMLRHFPIPFGTFLCAAALFAAFFGDRLLHWYWNLF